MRPRHPAERIKDIEREYQTAVFAIEELESVLHRDPSFLDPGLSVSDLRRLRENLESTYLIRMFAEFEAMLTHGWQLRFHSSRRIPRARPLIDAIAKSAGVPLPLRDLVHDVRKYRNILVHSEATGAHPIALHSARSRLCQFVSRLSFR